MKDSEIKDSHLVGDSRVQDPYCLRCQPQVMGACIDLLRQAASILAIEANAVTDNPLILSSEGDGTSLQIISGGNFHAEPVAFAADQIAIALSEIGAIAQRRIAILVDPKLVDVFLRKFSNMEIDYLSNQQPVSYPDGLDIEVCSFKALKQANNEATSSFDKEHVTSYLSLIHI